MKKHNANRSDLFQAISLFEHTLDILVGVVFATPLVSSVLFSVNVSIVISL